MMTYKELKMKTLADPETRAEYEAQKPEFELLDKQLEARKSAGSRLKPCRDDDAVNGVIDTSKDQ